MQILLILTSIKTILILGSLCCCCADPLEGYGISPVEQTEYPFIVALAFKKETNEMEKTQFCGGALISTRHVITIAHCVRGRMKDDVQVLAGSPNLRSTNVQRFDVKEWVFYESWAFTRNVAKDSAIDTPAVVVLKKHITNITPVVRSKVKSNKLGGSSVTMAGWGLLDTGLRPINMQKAALKILPKKKCKQRMGEFLKCLRDTVDHESIICTAAKPHALGGYGDSGDPVLDEKRELVGIHIGVCPDLNLPHPRQINTGISVYYYKEFIDEVMMIYM